VQKLSLKLPILSVINTCLDNFVSENVAKAKEELDRWNKMLVGKEFLCGNEFTMGDVFFIPFLAILKRLGATLSGHPELNRYYDSICGRPSVQATWPPHWKEGPGPDLLNKDL
jgi:glutathione S-transferase